MRAPNLAIFIVTLILAAVGVWQYIGAPLSLPEITLPLVGISTSEISPFLTANAFWLVFLAWALLAIAALLPHRAVDTANDTAKAASADHHAAEPKPAS